MAQALTRRDRVRAATIDEIKQTARRLLVAEGPEAVSLRAIAREMGMTAPALYRYFSSHEDLLRHVIADMFSEIASDIRAAMAAEAAAGGDLPGKLVVASREFRRWSLNHTAEFGLLFGTPLPALAAVQESHDVAADCAQEFSGVFFGLFDELWRKRPFPVPGDEDIDPALRVQLQHYREVLRADLPLGAMVTFLRCWVRLYGMVALEVFGHLHFALEDASPMFEWTLSELAALLGLESPPPAAPAR